MKYFKFLKNIKFIVFTDCICFEKPSIEYVYNEKIQKSTPKISNSGMFYLYHNIVIFTNENNNLKAIKLNMEKASQRKRSRERKSYTRWNQGAIEKGNQNCQSWHFQTVKLLYVLFRDKSILPWAKPLACANHFSCFFVCIPPPSLTKSP